MYYFRISGSVGEVEVVRVELGRVGVWEGLLLGWGLLAFVVVVEFG
jgi:hypothetical protein